MKLRRPGDWHDPRPLRKQPSERDLSRCRLLSFCYVGKQINQGLIRFASFWGKARDDVAEISAIELRILGDLAGEKTLTKGAKWNESDSEFFEGRQHFFFRASPPQRVFALNCRDRLDSVCATDGLHSWFRKSEMLHLALLDEVLHRSRYVFDRHVRINTVLIKQIDDIGLEPLERAFGNLLDVFWPTIEGSPLAPVVGIGSKAELGCYDYPVAEWSKRFADKFFVGERTVHFSGVEEGDAAFDG